MLKYLCLKNVGPAPKIEFDLGERINLITGDNGLGKSFLLDVAWWALTRKWPQDLNRDLTSGYPARPTDPTRPSEIHFKLKSKSRDEVEYKSTYSAKSQSWEGKAGRPWNPGLVIYAHVDGGFSVWDPARNYWKVKGRNDVQDSLPGYVFSAKQVWEGLELEIDGKRDLVCNGLLLDWAIWIRENGENARRMEGLLQGLAPAGETLAVSPHLHRLSVNSGRDIPAIRTAYADSVPIVHASSGVRRVVGLAYMLLWSWLEHCLAAESRREDRASQVILLFDEIESHLHPRWQRSILKSILGTAQSLHESRIQLLAVTHSPLILASAEPLFDPAKDAWFDLDLASGPKGRPLVQLQQRPFVRRGTAGRWLTSPAFDLASEGRSIEAEGAIAAAEELLDRYRATGIWQRAEVEAVDKRLREVLSDIDRFWVRWSELVDGIEV